MPSAAAVRQPPAAERVYHYVKQAVLERHYEGGMLLTEGELAEAVGVSRTPVREALLRLEVEGLIQLYPKKGALVLPVSAQEIEDVVETRLLVEQHAVHRAVPVSDALVRRLEELLEEQRAHAAAGDLAAVSVADRCFHATIVKATGNQILTRLYDQLRDRQLRMGVAVMHAHPERIAKNLTEHSDILRALREGDTEAAALAVHQHVSRVRHLVRGEDRRGDGRGLDEGFGRGLDDGLGGGAPR
ncbi:GntR family transcriptional regulator [Streptomyces sp. NBC_01795]|uniref:GntR family transcriptional regulator n=1 Tax=unclassified Streptomyces TaxID=2593676 RepID=UPI002DD88457|nr:MULTISPECIES: GntR family transcriptional regulator [unclassified Streptomyces]WSA93563.1 GntR family transcriptional regulator [Streptomyces sp. NBC_01795]WSS13811.1 GntR family transcriptional regulator [Streptomyces sp. NBC_01186]